MPAQARQHHRRQQQRQIVADIAEHEPRALGAARQPVDIAGIGQRHEIHLLAARSDAGSSQSTSVTIATHGAGERRNFSAVGMDQRRKPDGADHGQHPVFCHQRQRAGEPSHSPERTLRFSNAFR